MVGGNDSHFVFHQKMLGEDGIMRRGVVMLKQPGLFSPKFWAKCSHVFKQSPQNIAIEPGIHCFYGIRDEVMPSVLSFRGLQI
jgi:hypothetical protein